MDDIRFTWLTEADIEKLAEIDRAETVRTGYVVKEGTLGQVPVEWDIPTFRTEGGGEHTVSAQMDSCRQHIRSGGRMVGALVDGRLVGLGVVTPDIRPRMAQLAYLHVSRAHRRRGIASRLTREMIECARSTGAERMYVSSTPSESAVGFCLRFGFVPTSDPIPELFALEPEDIHMMKDL